jgi:parvulin-like peptidyl-prolyl isomerase
MSGIGPSIAKVGKSGKAILLASGIVVLIAAIAGVAIYQDQVAPFQRTIVAVDGAPIPMGYFLARARLADTDPMNVLQTLVKEQLIKQLAPAAPYDISVTADDVDQFLRQIAQGKNSSISEPDYQEWLRQQSNESGLTGAEFKDLARNNMLAQRLTDYLAERVPTVAEQVHLHMIVAATLQEARTAKAKLDAGTDFAALARTFPGLENDAGDLGWFARADLTPAVAQTAFDMLALGKPSEPLPLDEQHYAVIMVSEKAARQIDGDSLRRASAAALDDWIAEQTPKHKVEFYGLASDSYDSETDAWVRWQIQRMKKQRVAP